MSTGTRSLLAFGALTLGASNVLGGNDVGGDKSESSAAVVLHGGRGNDQRTFWDGMYINTFYGNGGGGSRIYYPNLFAIQEVVMDTGANSVESETGGANVNLVPKEGSNAFRFETSATYGSPKLAASGVSGTALVGKG